MGMLECVCICTAASPLGPPKAPNTEPNPPRSQAWPGTSFPSSLEPIFEGLVPGTQGKAKGRDDPPSGRQSPPLCYSQHIKCPLCGYRAQGQVSLDRHARAGHTALRRDVAWLWAPLVPSARRWCSTTVQAGLRASTGEVNEVLCLLSEFCPEALWIPITLLTVVNSINALTSDLKITV